MISSFGKWLTRTLLSNPRIRDKIAANDHIMCVLFNLAHPDWLLAKATEKLSPWFSATEYKNIPVQRQPVYNPICGMGWCVRVLHPSKGKSDLGTVHHDLKIAFDHASEYIDEVNFCELKEKIEKLIELKKNQSEK